MRHVLAYPIWSAGADMINWFAKGIADGFDPSRVSLLFCLDGERACLFEPLLRDLCGNLLKDFRSHIYSTKNEIRDNGCHNRAIDYLMDATDADSVIVSQDDICFRGARTIDDLDRVLSTYGRQVGVIGMRDGYGPGYSNFVAPPFDYVTKPAGTARELPVGVFEPAMMVNPGPLVYPRTAVEAIGKLDPVYHDWYWWDDYALRAGRTGLTNVALSIDAEHVKFGDVRASDVAVNREGWAEKDIAILRSRYGNVL